jgi:hypothetical protein
MHPVTGGVIVGSDFTPATATDLEPFLTVEPPQLFVVQVQPFAIQQQVQAAVVTCR